MPPRPPSSMMSLPCGPAIAEDEWKPGGGAVATQPQRPASAKLMITVPRALRMRPRCVAAFIRPRPLSRSSPGARDWKRRSERRADPLRDFAIALDDVAQVAAKAILVELVA